MSAEIIHGDCLEVMKGMADNSVDSIVTDPPYGISFMSKKWDHDVPSEAIWREALRVLKPGGHLLSFFGSRTYHRGVVRIEDAGFEIRDQIMWVYGCLSTDTEVLVDGKWVPYHKATIGRHALCYNAEHDTFDWQPIEGAFLYPYSDYAYRIRSEDTDQLVSRNHRVIVEQGGARQFVLAEEAARQPEIHVPVLESLHGLPAFIPLPDERTGASEPDLFSSVHVSQAKSATGQEAADRAEADSSDLPRLWQGSDEARFMAAEGEGANLLPSVQRHAQGSGLGRTRTQGSSSLDSRIKGVIPHEDDRSKQPGLEGRRDDAPQQRQLQRGEIHALPGSAQADGPDGRIRNAAQVGDCGTPGALPAPIRSGSSHQPRLSGQSTGEPDAVQQQLGAQTVRGDRATRPTLATISPEWYEGEVWCLKVPTGAFVVRRNGKIFVTGNSGFPKSLDVSKTLDKAAGAEREVTGVRDTLTGSNKDANTFMASPRLMDVTAPATDAAKQWEGWGTALKPSHEPVVLARKPLIGTVAQNVQAHGTGALNIDGCRIKAYDKAAFPAGVISQTEAVFGGGKGRYDGRERTPDSNLHGRWPANLIHDGSDEVLAAFPTANSARASGNPNNPKRGKNHTATSFGQGNDQVTHDYRDSGSAARFFYTAKASRKDRGEGNTHATVKPTDLMRYLVRLITPPGGTVLDPFCGSGSTGKAAVLEGFTFIGIELDAEYVQIARARIANTQPALLETA